MGLKLEYSLGQTPLAEEELEALRIPSIATRSDLDEFEQRNIEDAIEWSLSRTFKLQQILSVPFLLEVHRQMFDTVWQWAGQLRRSNKNIGVDKFQISQEVKYLLEDCHFWIENETYLPDEIAVRFKHRLVKIHMFPNGNGRHARLCADILISHGFKKPVFTWSRRNLSPSGASRKQYLSAIYQADEGDIHPLLRFARS